jgi:hypothetical protein
MLSDCLTTGVSFREEAFNTSLFEYFEEALTSTVLGVEVGVEGLGVGSGLNPGSAIFLNVD